MSTHNWQPTVISASAVAAASASVTIPAVAGTTAYLAGFVITGGGATAASSITVSVTGLSTTMSFNVGVPTVSGGSVNLTVIPNVPIPASAANTTITVSMPSWGSGNLGASINAWGFYSL